MISLVTAADWADFLVCKRATDFTVFVSYYITLINTFKYNNLPSGILPFMPEEQLTYCGQTTFFRDDEGNFKIFPCYPAGNLLIE